MARDKFDKIFQDEETERRNRLMMYARFPAIVIAASACKLMDAAWPGMVMLGLWYLIWLVWVAGIFEHH